MAKKKPIPADASIEEAAQFYDSTNTTDLDGEDVEVEVARTPMVSHSIRFDRGTVDRIRAAAEPRGLGVTQLMRQWIEERLAEEEDPDGDERVTVRKADVLAAFRTLAEQGRTSPQRR